MHFSSRGPRTFRTIVTALFVVFLAAGVCAAAKELSDQQIAEEVQKETNKVIVDEFLKYELREVNEYATKPLLKAHPSLVFYIKQAERSPLAASFFLSSRFTSFATRRRILIPCPTPSRSRPRKKRKSLV